jgi:thioredoxin 1
VSAVNRASVTGVLLTLAILLLPLPLSAQQEVPERARGHFKAGVALIEKANKPADFLAAVSEFEAAAALAPQWPDIHYNLAKLAAEIDKPAKAIKEYRTYLTLVPAAADKAVLEGEMVRMKELIVQKRKVGVPGVQFVSMADGIGVLQIFPGSRVAKTGLQRGDKIVTVDNTNVVGMNLADFFKTVETSSLEGIKKYAAVMMLHSMATLKGDKTTSGPVVMLKVKRAGDDKEILVPCAKEMFRSQIIEIEEDEFDAEVLKVSLPVAVTFWSSGCQTCSEFIPAVEAESTKYAGRLKFVNVNVDENHRLAQQLAVKGTPILMVYKGGTMVSTDTGNLTKEKVGEILKSAAAR